MWHAGAGQSFGTLQFHSQLGCSQTFRQGWVLGHRNWHLGSLQVDLQAGHPVEGQACLGHITAQCGSPQCISHPEMSGPWQRVSQRGGWQTGSQISSHLALWHCHVHLGWQGPSPPSETPTSATPSSGTLPGTPNAPPGKPLTSLGERFMFPPSCVEASAAGKPSASERTPAGFS